MKHFKQAWLIESCKLNSTVYLHVEQRSVQFDLITRNAASPVFMHILGPINGGGDDIITELALSYDKWHSSNLFIWCVGL